MSSLSENGYMKTHRSCQTLLQFFRSFFLAVKFMIYGGVFFPVIGSIMRKKIPMIHATSKAYIIENIDI